MAGTIKANTVQLGDSGIENNNFHLKTNVDGSLSLNRGNDGATTQELIKVNTDGNQEVLGLPAFQCRAWVNFNGTRNVTDTGASVVGQPVFIRASGNVASVIKNGTGNYTVNFTIPMSDESYVSTGTVERSLAGLNVGAFCVTTSNVSNSQLLVISFGTNGGTNNTAFLSYDNSKISIAIFR